MPSGIEHSPHMELSGPKYRVCLPLNEIHELRGNETLIIFSPIHNRNKGEAVKHCLNKQMTNSFQNLVGAIRGKNDKLV